MSFKLSNRDISVWLREGDTQASRAASYSAFLSETPTPNPNSESQLRTPSLADSSFHQGKWE